jgi:hypothetical protein
MARIRSVHPELFLDDAFMELSAHARLLAIGIWTQCDDHGIFEWKPNYFKATILPVDAVDIPHLLAELEEQNCVKPFEEGGRRYGAVRNFCLYQRPKKPVFKHPFPDWCRTYVAVDRRKAQEEANQQPTKSPPVTPASPTAGENRSHSREEERSGREEESNTDREKPVVVVVPDEKPKSTTTTTDSPKALQVKTGLGGIMGRPLPDDWVPDEATCRKVEADFDMGLPDINAELPTFHALNVQNGTLSQDWAATFYLFAKQWKLRAARAAPRLELSKAPAKPFVPTEADFDKAAAFYARTGRWSRDHGPDPMSPACRCPSPILERHGINPVTGERSIPVKAVTG